MEKRYLKQLNEIHEEIADTLISLGMNRPIAKILSYLQHVNEATSVDIERRAELRQPEVSIAMKQLKELDWINEREEKKPGKGRPHRIYSLKIDFNDIVAQLDGHQRRSFNKSHVKIERLKELMKYRA